MKKNDRDNVLAILPSPNLKCSRLIVHLSVFIFQLLFQRPESLLQTLLFFQQRVSLGTKHLQSESNVKPMHGPAHQKHQTLLQTHLLCATGLLRGCGKLFFQLADLLKQLPGLPPRPTGPEHEEPVPKTQTKKKVQTDSPQQHLQESTLQKKCIRKY